MGNSCKSMADSFQCMTKPTTKKKKKERKKIYSLNNFQIYSAVMLIIVAIPYIRSKNLLFIL